MIPKSQLESFYRGEPSTGVAFGVNAVVAVISGPSTGVRGAVISLEALKPEVTYLVENGKDGSSFVIVQSALEPLGESSA